MSRHPVSAGAKLVESAAPEGLILTASGDWRVASAADLDSRIRGLVLPKGGHVALELAGIDHLDIAGAWLLLRTVGELKGSNNTVEIRNLPPVFAPLLDQVRAHGSFAARPRPRAIHLSLLGLLAGIGEISVEFAARCYRILSFLGLILSTAGQLARHPRRLRPASIVAQIEETGVNSLMIVGLLSFLIGIVIAYQGADQLRQFGAEIYAVNLLGIGILRELGVLMTAIIVAGRSGSAFTAQIGTMRVNEEIDALRTLGLDPIEILVIPRLIGLLLALPMLTVFANLMGLLGGSLIAWAALGITIPQFVHQLQLALTAWTFWIGIVKAPFFAVIIASIGCYEGFQVARNAESVGRLTTLSVVESIFLVIVTDAAFSVLFSLVAI